MKHYISKEEIFITYERRSEEKYQRLLTEHIVRQFGAEEILKPDKLKSVLEKCYDWASIQFCDIIGAIDDKLFVNYLFAYHEASVTLWIRVLGKEDIARTINVTEDDLAMNRRIFRLALEQTCDVTYKKINKATEMLLQQYDEVIEDLLFIGTELFGFAQLLAEMRIIPGTLEIRLNGDGILSVTRPQKVEAVFGKLSAIMKEDFTKGIFDEQGVHDMKKALKNCMDIDYDLVGHHIVAIKQHHSPELWEFQTIQPGILIDNLVNNGVSRQNASDFYNGLTISRNNKLPIKESVYKVNSMERYFFRPVLVLDENGDNRELIGVNKWAESITVLATNGFQWNKAASEWKSNQCFAKFLDQKSAEHDSLLEDQAISVLNDLKIPFDRNVVTFSDGIKNHIKVDVQGIGEMDLVWIDVQRSVIMVADCKYNRARYDMLAFSTDFTNFKDNYETKLANKKTWIEKNKDLVCQHFERKFRGLILNPPNFKVESMFIITTPTFYMYLGRTNTACFFGLKDFIENQYRHPDITVSEKTRYGHTIKVISYPYFHGII